jgi:hypothetical protein
LPNHYWSPKHKHFVLKYQVVISLKKSKIIHVSEGIPGSVHDMYIARSTGLEDLLRQNGDVCIGDKAYQGSPQFVIPFKRRANVPLTQAQLEHNRVLESFRNLIERMNERLKIWKSISSVWRHPIYKNVRVFSVVSKLTNISLTEHLY